MISNKVHRLCCFRIKSGNKYERYHCIKVMNEAHKEVLECSQQTIEWFPT